MYLRVTGMDEGLNIKERVSYVSWIVQLDLYVVFFLLQLFDYDFWIFAFSVVSSLDLLARL